MKKVTKEEVAYAVAAFLTIAVSIMFYTILIVEIPAGNKETFSNMSNLILGAWISMTGYLTSQFTKKNEDPTLQVGKSGDINVKQ